MTHTPATPPLSELVARVRAARPELAAQLPRLYTDIGPPPTRSDWVAEHCFVCEFTARAMIDGVLSRVLAEAGYGLIRREGGWRATAIVVEGKLRLMPAHEDYTTALVGAICEGATDGERLEQCDGRGRERGDCGSAIREGFPTRTQ